MKFLIVSVILSAVFAQVTVQNQTEWVTNEYNISIPANFKIWPDNEYIFDPLRCFQFKDLSRRGNFTLDEIMECKLNTPYGLSNPNKTSNKTIDWFNLADKDKDGILSVMEVLQISDLKQARYLNRT